MIVFLDGLVHYGDILPAHVFLALDFYNALPLLWPETYVQARIVAGGEFDRPGVRLAPNGASDLNAFAKAALRFAHVTKQHNLCDSFLWYIRRFEKGSEFEIFANWGWEYHSAFVLGVS